MSAIKQQVFNIRSLERGARFFMGVVAAMAVLVLITFKTGLIKTSADYDRQSWYLVTEREGYTITSQLADEAACRQREEMLAAKSAGSVCRSGASLADQAR